MGVDQSKGAPPVHTHENHMCIIFKIPDKIYVINASQDEYDIIYRSVKKTWEDGIQAVKRTCGRSILCYKLKGLPFETGIVSANVRQVICEILFHLHHKGWNHLLSTNLTTSRDSFTFIFTKQQPVDLSHLGYMSLSSHNKLQFVNLKAGTFGKILEASKIYDPGAHKGDVQESKNTYELLLEGSPWSGKSYNHAEARLLLIETLSIILTHHEFVCTMNVKRTQDTFLVHVKHTEQQVKTSDLFIVTLRKTKKIQIYNAPEELEGHLHQFMLENMERRGVGVERKVQHMEKKLQYKFRYPKSDTKVNSFVIKLLICKLLESMKSYGWSVVTGFDMSRGLSSKTELLFQRSAHLANCRVFCLSPLMKGRLALVNAPDGIVKVCHDVIKSHWHRPLQAQTSFENIIKYDIFTLEGDPWGDSSPDIFHTHALLCYMIHKFTDKGYRLVLAADVIEDNIQFDGGKSLNHDPNAWWFMHEPEFSLDYAQAFEPSLSVSTSDAEISPYMPSIGSVLRDDFTEPPFPDFCAHGGETSPSAPVPYEPCKTRGFSSNHESLEDLQNAPPPSYDQVMRQERLKR